MGHPTFIKRKPSPGGFAILGQAAISRLAATKSMDALRSISYTAASTLAPCTVQAFAYPHENHNILYANASTLGVCPSR